VEPRLGHDFSQVRVHNDKEAAESTKAVNALAYTVGRHIVFGAGQYAPQTHAGRRLLAHELAHVVQQRATSNVYLNAAPRVDKADGPAEQEAERTARIANQADRGTTEAQGVSIIKSPMSQPGPVLQRQTFEFEVEPDDPSRPGQINVRFTTPGSPAASGSPAACVAPYRRATTFQSLIDLVRAAETKLNAAGVTSTRDQIHALRGIYYGTTWSKDYAEEQSTTRNEGFQRFTRPSLAPSSSVPPDVRSILDCGLFEALQKSQDIVDGSRHVDFGHLIIALDARNDPALASNIQYPFGPTSIDLGGTGTELVTWLGDLGGGAAALASSRVSSARANASSVFTGSDYGGSINLEGDVAGFVVATAGTPTTLTAPTFAAGRGRLSDALQDYLSPSMPSATWINRANTFLRLYGANFDASTSALTNRPALISMFASKIQIFACNYLASRVRDKRMTFATARAAADHVIPASQEVATAFVDALEDSGMTGNKIEARRFPSPMSASPGACRDQVAAAGVLGTLGF